MIAPPSLARYSGWPTSSKAIRANGRASYGPQWGNKHSRRSQQHTRGQIELFQQFVVDARQCISAERRRERSVVRACDGAGGDDCGIRDASNSPAPKRTKATYFVRSTIVVTEICVHEDRIHLAVSDTVLKERRTARELLGAILARAAAKGALRAAGAGRDGEQRGDRRCQNTAEPKSSDRKRVKLLQNDLFTPVHPGRAKHRRPSSGSLGERGAVCGVASTAPFSSALLTGFVAALDAPCPLCRRYAAVRVPVQWGDARCVRLLISSTRASDTAIATFSPARSYISRGRCDLRRLA